MNGPAMDALCDKKLKDAERILERCSAENISVLTIHDPAYPSALKAISDPPVLLYYKGRLPKFDLRPVIAIVGSRKATAEGQLTAKRLGYQLSKAGVIVVSGMAKGVDGEAMEGALLGSSYTVGVLGCGLDVIYPKSNRQLYEETSVRGCLLSEYPPGTEPFAGNFPVRNRIMSGLSNGVVIVEASAKSGSLITARHALEQGRDVFAVPGSISSPHCEGSNRLLKEGAILVQDSWDILQEYVYQFPGILRDAEKNSAEQPPLEVAASPVVFPRPAEEKPIDKNGGINYIDIDKLLPKVSKTEAKILTALKDGPQHVDDIIEATELSPAAVLATVTLMEIKGYVQSLSGRRYSLQRLK